MSTTGASGSEGGGGKADTAASAAVWTQEKTEETESNSTDGAAAGRVRKPGPWWWARRRGVVLDVFLAFVSAVECAIEGVAFADRVGIPEPVFLLLGFVAGSTLVLRRQWPVAVVLVSLAVAPAQMGVVMATVGLYTLAASSVPRRITFSLAGLTTVGTFVVTVLDMHNDQQGRDVPHMPMPALVLTAFTVAVGVTVAPLLLGLYIGARRRLVESLVDRADGLERELALLAEKASERAQRARIEERTRIAREMHDVVAHRVSLMVVHAGALQSLAVRDPDKAVRSAELVGNMGRQALDELRTMLGVLRASETRAPVRVAELAQSAEPVRAAEPDPEPVTGQVDDAARAGAAVRGAQDGPESVRGADAVGRDQDQGGDRDQEVSRGLEGLEGMDEGRITVVVAAASTASAVVSAAPGAGPALCDVAQLVDESRAAGMAVELSLEGAERPLAVEAERTAYRVVQEALTNVHKHAPGAKALVRVAYRPDEVAVLVENGPSDGRPSAALPSGGNGLVGMRERVVALGGGFVAGPREGGGFRVSAMLPDRT